MKLLDNDIKEYQSLCLKLKLGSKSHEVAASELRDIVDLMKMVYVPITRSDLSRLDERNRLLSVATYKEINGEDSTAKASE